MQAAEIEAEMLQRYEQLHTQDLYQVLGMNPVASADEIRRAYYTMTRRFHPDTFRNDATKLKAEKVFGRITEAYSTLSHLETRRRYDEESLLSRTAGQHQDPARQTETMARMNFRQGKESYEHGHLAEALSFLQNACDQDPSRPEYFEYLGLTQAKNPRLRKQAEESLERAIGLQPTEARLYAHLAALYERAGATDRAHEMYRKALQWDPANAAALKALTPEAPVKKGLLGGLFTKK
jgi:curved DNA-binding protein CbpA